MCVCCMPGCRHLHFSLYLLVDGGMHPCMHHAIFMQPNSSNQQRVCVCVCVCVCLCVDSDSEQVEAGAGSPGGSASAARAGGCMGTGIYIHIYIHIYIYTHQGLDVGLTRKPFNRRVQLRSRVSRTGTGSSGAKQFQQPRRQ